MKKIHICHKSVGGVGEIFARLTNVNDVGITLFSDLRKALSVVYNMTSNDDVYFHQPKAHIFAFFLLPLLIFKKNKNIVLHESCDYTKDSGPIIKYMIGWCIRYVVINFLSKVGFNIYSISNFVTASYGVQAKPISFLSLFKSDLSAVPQVGFYEKNTVTVWLRKGTADNSFAHLKSIIEQYGSYFFGVYIYGEMSECSLFRNMLDLYSKSSDRVIHIFNENNFVSSDIFLKSLASSLFFISMYNKEGFGLSCFQALYLGCIVVTPGSGGLADWLPYENTAFSVYLSRLQGVSPTDYSINVLCEMSERNIDAAVCLIS